MKIILKQKRAIPNYPMTLTGVIRITPEAEIILRKLQPLSDDMSLCDIASQIIIQAHTQGAVEFG